jgi:alpha-L-fucosidase
MDEQGLFGTRAGALTMVALGTLIATCATGRCLGADAPADRQDLLEAKPEAVEAWKDKRFGMFICWGPVSLTGKEIGWSRGDPTPIEEYDALYKKWNPDKFDAREWIKVVKETGASYVVFLLKHHDGFCLWDTKQTDYNIMNGPFKRDVTKELAAACRQQGIGFFPYYSTCDWHHPDFPLTSPGGKVKRTVSNLDRYTEYLEAQVKELITGYGPLVGIWFDVPQGFDQARGERVIRFVRSLQRDALVNNRTGALGDFDTPEQVVGRAQFRRPWESCITLGTQWSWKSDDVLKSYTEAIQMLVACAVGDGNLVLNTNPMPDGRIEPRQVEQFRKIGQWLEQYGESIYGTRGGPFVAKGMGKRNPNNDLAHFVLPGGEWWGGATHRGNVIYLHILRWPADTLTLPALKRRIVKTSVLTGGKATIRGTGAGIEVSVPAAQRNPCDTIVKLELDGPAEGPPSPVSLGKPARASSTWESAAGYGAAAAFDGDAYTRWGAAENSRSGWIEVDLGAPTRVDRAVMDENHWNRVRQFELQAQQEDGWQTLASGTTIGPEKEIRFAPVMARVFRLNILKADDVPTINEVELYEAQ